MGITEQRVCEIACSCCGSGGSGGGDDGGDGGQRKEVGGFEDVEVKAVDNAEGVEDIGDNVLRSSRDKIEGYFNASLFDVFDSKKDGE